MQRKQKAKEKGIKMKDDFEFDDLVESAPIVEEEKPIVKKIEPKKPEFKKTSEILSSKLVCLSCGADVDVNTIYTGLSEKDKEFCFQNERRGVAICSVCNFKFYAKPLLNGDFITEYL